MHEGAALTIDHAASLGVPLDWWRHQCTRPIPCPARAYFFFGLTFDLDFFQIPGSRVKVSIVNPFVTTQHFMIVCAGAWRFMCNIQKVWRGSRKEVEATWTRFKGPRRTRGQLVSLYHGIFWTDFCSRDNGWTYFWLSQTQISFQCFYVKRRKSVM